MKKLFIILAIVLFTFGMAQAQDETWDISWEALTPAPDSYTIRYKPYPAGYGDQLDADGNILNPAPEAEIYLPPFTSYDNGMAMELADIPAVFNLTMNQRYTFYVIAVTNDNVVGKSTYLNWTYPDPDSFQDTSIEIPVKKIKELNLKLIWE